MNKQITENNIVKLSGIVSSEPVVTHELEGEKFWEFLLETKHEMIEKVKTKSRDRIDLG